MTGNAIDTHESRINQTNTQGNQASASWAPDAYTKMAAGWSTGTHIHSTCHTNIWQEIRIT